MSNMKVIMLEDLAKPFFTAVTKLAESATGLMTAAGKKFRWDVEKLEQETTAMTAEMMDRDLIVKKQEFENREKAAQVVRMELEAREVDAIAKKAEAQLRLRTTTIRNGQLSKNHHSNTNKTPQKRPEGTGGTSGKPIPTKFPSLEAQERKQNMEGTHEGKPLSHNLGDKMKATIPS